MSADWLFYLAGGGGGVLGVVLLACRMRSVDFGLWRPWLLWSAGIAFGGYAVLAGVALLNGAVPELKWTSKDAFELAFGLGLIFQLVATISGLIAGIGSLYLCAVRARDELR